MRTLRVLGLTLATLVASAAWVDAQQPIQLSRPGYSPVTRPTVSPYVNLALRRSPAINYFGIIQPQRSLRSSITQLSERVTVDEQLYQADAQAAAANALPTTGHVAGFMSYSHYYPSLGSGTVIGHARQSMTTATYRRR